MGDKWHQIAIELANALEDLVPLASQAMKEANRRRGTDIFGKPKYEREQELKPARVALKKYERFEDNEPLASFLKPTRS